MVSRHRSARVLALLPLLLAACRSGGDDGPPISVGFDDAVSAWDEGTETLVTVRLSTPVPLTEPVTVEVVDLGTGTAAPGTDYSSGPLGALVFPTGSVDGTALAVRLPLLADGLFEGRAETIELGLRRDPTATVTVGLKTTRHEVRIQEADRLEVSFVAAAATITEGLADHHAIQVRLTSSTGSATAVPVEVVVADTRSGSATPGSDYAFPRTRLTFSAVDTVRTAFLDPVADGTIEGDETVRLALEAATPGVEIAGPFLVCTLTEPAQPGTPRLVLRSGGVSFSPEGELPLVETGPAAGAAELELLNAGSEPLRFGFPRVDGAARDFRVEWLETGPIPLPFTSAGALEWSELASHAADPAGAPARVRVTTLGPAGQGWTLALLRRPSIRAATLTVTTPEAAVYAGSLEGEPDSTVFVQLGARRARGRLERPTGSFELRSDGTWLPVPALATPPPCPAPLPPAEQVDTPWLAPRAGGGVGASGLPVLRLALETDTAYADLFPDVEAATTYAEGLVAATREILMRDFGFDLELVYLGLWPDGIDPWVTPDAGGTASGLLNEFRTRWVREGPPVQAELYHFVSGGVFGGGIAELSTYCRGGYGVSTGIHGGIDWDAYDGTPGFLTGDLGLFAHEIGHNLGARHTQDFCPPLDRCVGTCLPGAECTPGTIMSYCSLCGGWRNVLLRMHAGSSSEVRELADVACLRDGVLAGGQRLVLRITHEFDPLSETPPAQRKGTLLLRAEGLDGSASTALVLRPTSPPLR